MKPETGTGWTTAKLSSSLLAAVKDQGARSFMVTSTVMPRRFAWNDALSR